MIVSGLPSTSESLRRMPLAPSPWLILIVAGEGGGKALAVLLEGGGETQHLAVRGVHAPG